MSARCIRKLCYWLATAGRIFKYRLLYRKYREYTMASQADFWRNMLLVYDRRNVSGCVVECGVWRGGMSAGMAEVLGPEREYILFDSFEGLPPVSKVDGYSAAEWQANKRGATYFDNCRAPMEYAQRAMALSGAKKYQIIKGWFKDTLIAFKPSGPIAVLRLDGDWYDSTMIALESLFDHLSPHALVIVDDYFAWDGCALAVHDYLSKRKLPVRIRSVYGVCVLEIHDNSKDSLGNTQEVRESMGTKDQSKNMTFINKGHLGGYAKSDPVNWPNGDPMTFTPALWDWMIDRYQPKIVWDVGCAEGHAVRYFLKRGCEAWGIDGCIETLLSLVVPRDRIIIHDYTTGQLSKGAGVQLPDFVYSCEFVEHVGREYLHNYMATFALARVVCFTHAFEGQDGHHHVNCQKPEYWISIMREYGFVLDYEATNASRKIAGTSHWERSGMIFTKQKLG